jgi:hypothetical protein
MIPLEGWAAADFSPGYIACHLRYLKALAVKSTVLLGLMTCLVSLKLLESID